MWWVFTVSNIAFCFSVHTNGTLSIISSHDIQPSVPVPSYQPPAQTFSGIIYDRGLMEAVTNAQNFVAQTFPGARLLESHNVSSPFVCWTSSNQNLRSADDNDRGSNALAPTLCFVKIRFTWYMVKTRVIKLRDNQKSRTGRLDHAQASHFDDEIGFFQEVFAEKPSPSCQFLIFFNF